MPPKKNLLLKGLDEHQVATIRHFISFNDWEDIEEEEVDCEELIPEPNIPAPNPENNVVHVPEDRVPEQPQVVQVQGLDLLREPEADECQLCYLQPCAITYRQSWLQKAQPPRLRNTGIRKKMYKKFWSVLDYRTAWRDARYQLKKYTELRSDFPNENLVWATAAANHQREIMPECVLKFVRELYPNPPDKPYMGHRWH